MDKNEVGKTNSLEAFNLITRIIDEFISRSTGINLYFCKSKDAESALKYFTNKGYTVNSQILQRVNSTINIDINYFQPQVLEIFLDLNCERGFIYLEQSWKLFNSSYRWLLWTEDYYRTMDQLQLSRVLLDSSVTLAEVNNNSVTTYDVHKVHRSLPFTVTKLKYWTPDGTVYKLDEPKPRDDFMGVNINASFVIRKLNYSQSNFMQLLMDPSYFPGVETQQRFSLRLLSHISERYNFTISLFFAKTWGFPSKNGTFDGMIGLVQSGTAEISGSFSLYFTARMKAVDFLMEFAYAKSSFLFLQPKKLGSYKALITPFKLQTWMFIFLMIIIFILIMSFKRFTEGNLSDKMLLLFSSISQQGGPENIETFSGKMLFVTILLFSFLLVTYYCTAILGGLILPAPVAIQNWDQLMKSDLQLGIEDDFFLRNELQSDDKKSIEIRNKLDKVQRVYYNINEGFQKIRKGGFAFHLLIIDNYWLLQDVFSDSEICSLTEIEKINKGPVSLIGQKNSPYKEQFRRTFQLLYENGITNAQRKLWISGMPECHWRQEKVIISMKTLSFAFAIFIIGLFVSFITFLIEVFIFNRNNM